MTTTTDKAGKYSIIREIAQGGFGRTLLAEDLEGKRVVLKQENPQQYNAGSEALQLFHKECDRQKELGHHDQIPGFIEYFEEGENRYIAQEFIDGQTLKSELEESGAFSEEQIIALLDDILPVIQFIHNNQVIHRDIKPDNIIRRFSDNKLVLVDFGASKPITDTVLAKTGTMIGSPLFVAPEQSRGKARYASDIYSLGLTCAHLLTNVSPFDLVNEDDGRWIWQDYCTQVISDDVALVINTMLNRGLKDRYKSASEVLDAIAAIDQPDQEEHWIAKAFTEMGGKDSLDPESTFPWEQQENEPDAWFERFEIFLHMTSDERDVHKACKAYFLANKGDRDSSLEEWVTFFNRFNWETRANAYDESAIGGFLKHVQAGDKSGPLAIFIRPLAAFVATVTVLGVAVTLISPDSSVFIQEPSVIEQPVQEPERDDGILPRFPILDDLKDDLVADMGHSKELAQGFNHMFFVMKIMLILFSIGAILPGIWIAIKYMVYAERN
ncbi:serine/threonine-protein kinase [Acaryochloris marina]|uniref:serine/threonine-protein kinase n=1 Tax=Acaryochloris marina TaxID=155978 RepID=UPI001BB0A401|nr:serine/threonine-protein kinase [Acaryochloris marina]QUY45457.1 serine/threonine protein kinase [Acaryochloris marina S15]